MQRKKQEDREKDQKEERPRKPPQAVGALEACRGRKEAAEPPVRSWFQEALGCALLCSPSPWHTQQVLAHNLSEHG